MKIFVDTGALIALQDSKDQFHSQFVELFNKYLAADDVELFTTDYVIDELLTFMRCSKKEPIDKVIGFIRSIQLGELQLISINEHIFGAALNLMSRYKDQYFSFTDCVSFVLMQSLKIKNVLTTDKHFEIKGFKRLT